jgi:uncharacterized protein YajQ (UPF0234 family)
VPSFDVTSEVDLQEVRNAVDQAAREVATRFDFKGTGTRIELDGREIRLLAPSEERLRALVQVLEERLVRRKVSLKALSYGRPEQAAHGALRQVVALSAGIGPEHARRIHRIVRDLGLKGVSSETQGERVRVTGKKRDDLQAVIARLKAEDLGIPLQFGNYRD